MTPPSTFNRSTDQIIDMMQLCVTSGVGNMLIGDNEQARLVVSYRAMQEALQEIGGEAAQAALATCAAVGDDWPEQTP